MNFVIVVGPRSQQRQSRQLQSDMYWERAGRGKKLLLKSQTLEFGVKYGGNLKTAEINEAFLRRGKVYLVQLGKAGCLGKGHCAPTWVFWHSWDMIWHSCSGTRDMITP